MQSSTERPGRGGTGAEVTHPQLSLKTGNWLIHRQPNTAPSGTPRAAVREQRLHKDPECPQGGPGAAASVQPGNDSTEPASPAATPGARDRHALLVTMTQSGQPHAPWASGRWARHLSPCPTVWHGVSYDANAPWALEGPRTAVQQSSPALVTVTRHDGDTAHGGHGGRAASQGHPDALLLAIFTAPFPLGLLSSAHSRSPHCNKVPLWDMTSLA